MRDHRWSALAAIVVTVVAGTLAMRASWLEFPAKGVTEWWTRDDNAGWQQPLAEFAWAGVVLFAIGITFGMLVGKRRSYLPRLPTLVLAILGALSTIGMIGMILWLRALPIVDVSWQSDGKYDVPWAELPRYLEQFSVAFAAYVALVAPILVTVTAAWLWRIAVNVADTSSAALAKANRELAARDGDLVPPAEDDVPRL